MNSIAMNYKYKAKVQWTMLLWYLVIYGVSMALVYWGLLKFSLISESGGSFIYRLWGSVVFLFAISIRFKEDFDFMLTLSSRRIDIFWAYLGVALSYSALMSGLIVLERVLVDYFNALMGYRHLTDALHFWAPYTITAPLLQFFYFLMLSLCASLAGLLIGSLFYRLGRKFMMLFWLVFSALPMVVTPLLLWMLHQRSQLAGCLKALGDCLKGFDVLVSSCALFALSLVFSVFLYLNMRKLPQR